MGKRNNYDTKKRIKHIFFQQSLGKMHSIFLILVIMRICGCGPVPRPLSSEAPINHGDAQTRNIRGTLAWICVTIGPQSQWPRQARHLFRVLSFTRGAAEEGGCRARRLARVEGRVGEAAGGDGEFAGGGGSALYRSITGFLHHSSKLCGMQTEARREGSF